MKAYKIEATITKDGRITLPASLKKLFNRKIELFLLEKEIQHNKNKIAKIPSYSCGGKLADFTRENLYEPRL